MNVSGMKMITSADLFGFRIGAPPRSTSGKSRTASRSSKKYVAVSESDQERAASHFRLAWKAIQKGHLEAALVDLRYAVEIDPSDGDFQAELVWVLSELGRAEEALHGAETLIDLSPTEDWPWKMRAQALRQLGRLEEAEKSFNRVLGRRPADVEALHGQALVFQCKGDLETALDYARRTVRADREYSGGYSLRDDLLYQLGRRDEALSAYEETSRRWPKDGYARSRIGELLWESGRRAEARTATASFLKACPNDAMAHMQSGFLLMQDEKFEEALRFLNTSIRLDDSNAHAYLNVGEVLSRTDRAEDAKAAYERAIEISPAPYIHSSYGVALLRADQPKAALRQFISAVRGDPEIEGLFARLGETFQKLGKDVWAAHAFREAVRREGATFYLIDQLATSCLYSGQFSEALEVFENATKLESSDETIAKRSVAEDTIKSVIIVVLGVILGARNEGIISKLDDDDFHRVAYYIAERFPADRREKFVQNFLRSVAEAIESASTSAAVAAAAAPVKKLIPGVAPELYADRTNRRENPEQFILRVYGNPIDTGMSQPDLPRLDPKLHQAYRSWKLNHKPTIDLPTKDEMLARLSPEVRLGRRQAAGREASARHRAKASMQ